MTKVSRSHSLDRGHLSTAARRGQPRGARDLPARVALRRRPDVRSGRALHVARVLPARARRSCGTACGRWRAARRPSLTSAITSCTTSPDVRTSSCAAPPSAIQAFHNVCRHRGRLLREVGGTRSSEFRCPFHGFAWEIDGSLKHVPCEWDFPQIENPADWGLLQAQVATWGGFVFINPDLERGIVAVPSRRPHRAVRLVALGGSVHAGSCRQGHQVQLEGRPGGLHGGDARGDDTSAVARQHR